VVVTERPSPGVLGGSVNTVQYKQATRGGERSAAYVGRPAVVSSGCAREANARAPLIGRVVLVGGARVAKITSGLIKASEYCHKEVFLEISVAVGSKFVAPRLMTTERTAMPTLTSLDCICWWSVSDCKGSIPSNHHRTFRGRFDLAVTSPLTQRYARLPLVSASAILRPGTTVVLWKGPEAAPH